MKTKFYPSPHLLSIAYIKKLHATKGGMLLQWFSHTPNGLSTDSITLEPGDFIFLSHQGLPTPFCIESYREFPNGNCVLSLHTINTPQQAQELVGATVYLDPLHIPQDEDTSPSAHSHTPVLPTVLPNTPLLDQNQQPVGIISHIEAYSLNQLLHVKRPQGDTVLIPFHPHLIIQAPTTPSAPLIMHIPQGLLDL